MHGSLPFPFVSDDDRLRFAELLNDRPFTDRARKFLRLAHDGLTEYGKAGLRVRYYDNALLISCQQARLAELLECSVRTVQRMIDDELAAGLGILEKVQTVPQTDGPPVQKTVYVVFLDRLEALPVLDPTDELDSVILDRNGDLRQDGSRRFSHPECDVVPGVVSDVVSPMTHGHEQDMNKKPMIHGHDHGDQRSASEDLPDKRSPLLWSKQTLTNETVRRIVRSRNLAELLRIDQEGRTAFGWSDSEQALLGRLAMWHHVATHPKVKHPSAVLKARMKDGERDCLKQVDIDWAAAMLRERNRGSPVPVVVKLPDPAESDPDTLSAQQARQRQQLAAVRVMQRQNAAAVN